MTREATKVTVDLAERSYDILVGSDQLANAGTLIQDRLSCRPEKTRIAVVTDDLVAGHHLETLTTSLETTGFQHSVIVVPSGEASKNIRQLETVLSQLIEARIERNDIVIALGGGVIGDLAGFAASVLRRGVDVVQIPTTLLSQVDSSVGGKTAVNMPQGKNLVGTFHQPRLVIADIDLLDTLPPREIRTGYAEIVKYGLIDDPDFFAWLEENGPALLAGDKALRQYAVIKSCEAKARIVAGDERESGNRALLNLGHTFGHALEAEMGYGDGLRHGEAISIGLRMAFDFSVRLGLCPEADAARLQDHMADCGLPVHISDIPGKAQSGKWEASRLLDHMRQDKKVSAGQMTFILARKIGESFVTRDIEADDLLAALSIEATR
jgi:3-dehydroquinate synthase